MRVVYGPGTFINSSVTEITEQLQAQTRARAAQAERANEAARRLARVAGALGGRGAAARPRRPRSSSTRSSRSELLALNAKYGLNLTGAPKVNDPDFVYQLVFDPARGARVPKARFAYLFPSADSALVSVRLKAGLTRRASARGRSRWCARRCAMPEWRLDGGGRYVVTGVPVLAGDLTDVLAALDAAAAAGRGGGDGAGAGAAVPRAAAAAAAGGWRCARWRSCSAALAVLGLPLTMASIAVLPVLLGLAVDYAIQYQARAASVASRSPPRRWRRASASWSCCCRRCRWCAGSARCWSSAWAWRSWSR